MPHDAFQTREAVRRRAGGRRAGNAVKCLFTGTQKYFTIEPGAETVGGRREQGIEQGLDSGDQVTLLGLEQDTDHPGNREGESSGPGAGATLIEQQFSPFRDRQRDGLRFSLVEFSTGLGNQIGVAYRLANDPRDGRHKRGTGAVLIDQRYFRVHCRGNNDLPE